ncbi:MAG: ribosome biogenesis factor YjgA [Nitrosomonas sp.]|nr:ribosome biogenesis factor YjgA [Nitrosomonas sp.]
MIHDSHDDNESEEILSKTRRKKAMHALQGIGEQLVELDSQFIAELDLPEILVDAIREAKQLTKHEAKRRQMQYIGKLMRNIDAAPIQEKIDYWKNRDVNHTAWLHRLENWRTRLLADENSINEFKQHYPETDIQHLRALIRNAHKETLSQKPPKSFRAIFQELRTIIPEKK